MRLGITDGSIVNRHGFFDEEVFAMEAEPIFGRSWQFVGHESEVAQPGDYVTRFLGSDEVIVARAEDGSVRVMLNSCRHRGVKLCAADLGNTSHFRCGYHGWTFSNDGRLRGVPHAPTLYSAGIDRKSLGLKEARIDIRHGLIFATFNGEIGDLEAELGPDALWYLETLVGKTEFEVYGPPARALGEFNWKSHSENWTGDFYHGDVTHHTVFQTSLLLDMEAIIGNCLGDGVVLVDSDGNAASAMNAITMPGGSGLIAIQLPHTFSEPVFPGYEKHLWAEFTENLTADQVSATERRTAITGEWFPNFGIAEDVVTAGEGMPPINVMNLRMWRPVSATQTEIWSWLLVPKRASELWKTQAQRSFTRSFGFAGMLELDDFHNWNSTSQANQGSVAMALDNDYSAPAVEPSTDLPWRGSVYPGPMHDVQFRAFFAEWASRMQGAGAEFACAEPVDVAGVPVS
jgi:phenylpropionate dioxygenase-like ring-hydroxylating dioxygenase large terminal subunit